MNSTFILVVQSQTSSVSFLCRDPLGAQLHSLSHAEDGSFNFETRDAIADGRRSESLSAGVYVLFGRNRLAVGCHVQSGDVSVIVPSGGEDPWPTPPPPKVQALEGDEAERANASAGENSFPRSPPPILTAPMHSYVKSLMNAR